MDDSRMPPKHKRKAPPIAIRKALGLYLDGKAQSEIAFSKELGPDGWVLGKPSRPKKSDRIAGVKKMQCAMLKALQSSYPLPIEMRRALAWAFEELIAGISSDLLIPARGSGRPVPPINKILQEAAIRYIRWAQEGRIVDDRPRETIAMHYRVSLGAVGNWCRAWENQKMTPPALDDATHVTRMMEICGARYRRT